MLLIDGLPKKKREKWDARRTKETTFVLDSNLYFCSIQLVRGVDLGRTARTIELQSQTVEAIKMPVITSQNY